MCTTKFVFLLGENAYVHIYTYTVYTAREWNEGWLNHLLTKRQQKNVDPFNCTASDWVLALLGRLPAFPCTPQGGRDSKGTRGVGGGVEKGTHPMNERASVCQGADSSSSSVYPTPGTMDLSFFILLLHFLASCFVCWLLDPYMFDWYYSSSSSIHIYDLQSALLRLSDGGGM